MGATRGWRSACRRMAGCGALLATAALAGATGAQEGEAGVSVTVYPQGVALVRVTLPVPLAAGRQSVRLDELPAGIDVASLLALDAEVALLRAHGLRGWDEDLGAGVSLRLELDVAAPRELLRLAYLTHDLDWSASYAVVVTSDAASARLDGYATVTNASAVTFQAAEVQLVAGDVNVASSGTDMARAQRFLALPASPAPRAAPEPQAASFGDVHLYTLPEPLTLARRDVHRVRLLGGSDLATEIEYSISHGSYGRPQRGEPEPESVAVRYRIRRPAGSAFGDIVLPAGIVRLFGVDDEGRLQLLGAPQVGDTPAGQDLVVPIGRAFDIQATRTQSDFRRLGEATWEAEWVVALTNGGERDVQIQVEEWIDGEWELVNATHEGRRRTAGTLQFLVPVTAGGETELRFRVRVRE